MGALIKVYRSERYRAFIKEHPCLICGRTPCDPHHEPLGKAGTSIKAPDSHCVPLCFEHHSELHNTGVKTFWKSIDVKMRIIEYLTEYLSQ